MTIYNKLEKLKQNLFELGAVAVAFSGGVDSAFLLNIAAEVLPKEKLLAITAQSSTFPKRELLEAADLAKRFGVSHEIIVSKELELKNFADNPANRCYYCKHELFGKIFVLAKKRGLTYVVDGSNLDDQEDFRPGRQAASELGVKRPLEEAGLTKEDIRKLSQERGLPTWNKPAFACLASRVPYGQPITAAKLNMIEKAEQLLIDLGFRETRVRHHGDVARIEVGRDERGRFFEDGLMDKVHSYLQSLGFQFAALDLKGYQSGNLNTAIPGDIKREYTLKFKSE